MSDDLFFAFLRRLVKRGLTQAEVDEGNAVLSAMQVPIVVTAPAPDAVKDVEGQLTDLIGREGGYVNNPADHGGPTMFGITEQVARAHGYAGDMRELPEATAREIYRSIYWQRPGLDAIAARAPRLAAELLDTAVNMGPKAAIGFLQRALNVLNRSGSDYPDIAADGDGGPMTVHSLDGLLERRKDGEIVLSRACECLKGARYIAIAEKNPSQETFEYGWLANRIGAFA